MKLFVIAFAFALVVAACKPVTQPLAGPDPVNPAVQVPPVGHQSAISRYVSRRPVEPKPWTEQNERVTPRGER